MNNLNIDNDYLKEEINLDSINKNYGLSQGGQFLFFKNRKINKKKCKNSKYYNELNSINNEVMYDNSNLNNYIYIIGGILLITMISLIISKK